MKKKNNNKNRYYSFEDSQYNSKKNKKCAKNNKNEKQNKIIVDNIDNIYFNVSKLPNKLFKQKIILLFVIFNTNLFHSLLLFYTKRKYDYDYCYTNYNQFEACISEEFCNKNQDKIFFFIYNDTYLYKNKSLSEHEYFTKEMKIINEFYKPFVANYSYSISKNSLFILNDKTIKNTLLIINSNSL